MENTSDQVGNAASVIDFVSDWRRLNVEPAIQTDQSRASSGMRSVRIHDNY